MYFDSNRKTRHLSVFFTTAVAFVAGLCSSSNAAFAKAQDETVHTPSSQESTLAIGAHFDEGRIEDWNRLAFAEYSGPKIRIAFGNLGDRSSAAADEDENDEQDNATRRRWIASILRQLTIALDHTGRFDISASAESDEVHVEYLISGAVQDWIEAPAVVPGAYDPQRPEPLQAGMAMSLRVVDAQTRQVLFATTERARVGLLAGGSLSTAAISNETVDAARRSATDACIDKSAYRLVGWFENQSWSGRVASVRGSRISINAGRRQGLRVGMTLKALAHQRELVDPETGIILGSVTENVGLLEIVDVGEETAIATIVGELKGLKPGDRVEWRPPLS